MPRVEVRCAAHIKWGEHLLGATLRNISARGLQIEGDELPAVGSYVSVFVEGLNIPRAKSYGRAADWSGSRFSRSSAGARSPRGSREVIRKGAN